MGRPTKRDVERAIQRVESAGGSPEVPGGRPDTKLLLGVSLDAFDLPDEARQYVEQAGEPDHPAPVVHSPAGSAEETLEAAERVGDSIVGLDVEAIRDAAQGAEEV